MNHHDESEHEKQLFARLAQEMNTDATADASADESGRESAPVVDLDKERSARMSADASTTPAADESTDDAVDPSTVRMVDGSAPAGPGRWARMRAAERRPVVPDWARSKPELLASARWLGGHVWHTVAFHGIRLPYYTARLAVQAPRGTAKFVGGRMRWAVDTEGEPLRQGAARREDAGEYLKLTRQRDRRVRWRSMVMIAASLMGLTVALAMFVLAPGWLLMLSGAVVTLMMGRLGAPADEPIIQRAVVAPKVQKLTSDIVLRALGALGIPAINQAQSKGREGFTFTAPITRDGPGWRAEGDLPYGVTVTDIIEKRDKLASGLRRPLGCVWPDAESEEHPGRLVLWVGDQDMKKAKKPAWPLAKAGTVDLFKPVAYGTDQRGRWVEVTLMYLAGVIGAIPRMGKTFLLRLLLLIAALDPRAELHTYDMKGTGDLDPVGNAVSHRHAAGDDDEAIAYALADFRELREELRRRTKVIRNLPRDVCPENKVTSALADKRSLGLHPIVVAIDECQVLFEHPEHGKEFEEIATDLVKRGPATGIVLLAATQRPDAKSLPTGISANASARWCLKVMGQTENDMVLGTSAYKRGVRATMFAWGDKGIHYFVGEGSDARIVAAVYVDGPGADTIAARARTAREKAGPLTGHALGEAPEVVTGPAFDLLADILAVVPAKETKAWNTVVVDRLAELRPEVYGPWGELDGEAKTAQLTNALKPHGIKTGQVGRRVDGKTVNQRGITRAHLTAAIAERDGKQDAA